jgi:hypothetical protein
MTTPLIRAADSLISEELAANHHSLAHDLQEEALGASTKSNTTPNGNGLTALPKDRRSGEQLILLQNRAVDTSKLILTKETRQQIDRLIDEWRHRLKLARYGYHPRSRILFWGPPGCGKTLTAHFLAEQFNLQIGFCVIGRFKTRQRGALSGGVVLGGGVGDPPTAPVM